MALESAPSLCVSESFTTTLIRTLVKVNRLAGLRWGRAIACMSKTVHALRTHPGASVIGVPPGQLSPQIMPALLNISKNEVYEGGL
jgi:hypothetical protein